MPANQAQPLKLSGATLLKAQTELDAAQTAFRTFMEVSPRSYVGEVEGMVHLVAMLSIICMGNRVNFGDIINAAYQEARNTVEKNASPIILVGK